MKQSVMQPPSETDRKSTRLNSSHQKISYAVFCLKKKTSVNNTSCALRYCRLGVLQQRFWLRGLAFGCFLYCFFFNDTATTEIYTLSLHDALPISASRSRTSRAASRMSWRSSTARA